MFRCEGSLKKVVSGERVFFTNCDFICLFSLFLPVMLFFRIITAIGNEEIYLRIKMKPHDLT